jgi:rRNA maturation endonuclease Nob1
MPFCRECRCVFGRNLTNDKKIKLCPSCAHKINIERVSKIKKTWEDKNAIV